MHALLIGTTGMLAAATKHVACTATRVTLVARHASTFSLGDPALDARLNPVEADWTDEQALLRAVDQAAEANGAFGLALVWLHPKAPDLRTRLASRMTAPPRRYIEVLGSAASRPDAFGDRQLAAMGAREDVRYSQVILGFVVDGDRSRWLTDAEIAAAAIRALESDAPRTVAGQVEPWDRKP